MNKWITYGLAAVAVGFVAAYLLIAKFRDAVNGLVPSPAAAVAVHPTTGVVTTGSALTPEDVLLTPTPVSGSTPISAPGGTLTSSATVNGGITATTNLIANPQQSYVSQSTPLGTVTTPNPNITIATQTLSTPLIQSGVTTGQPAPLTSDQLLAIAQAANAAANALLAAGTVQQGAQIVGIPIRDANGNITGYNYTTTSG